MRRRLMILMTIFLFSYRRYSLNKLCIYHKNCADGFAAALAVRKGHPDETLEFYAASYQTAPPSVAGRDVIIVDFSYKRDVLLEMAKEAKSILVLDHHESAERELDGELPENVTVHFDMSRSGAVMAWHHFLPRTEMPALYHYIQDRDLWKFELEATKEVMAAVFMRDYSFDDWEALLEREPEALAMEGTFYIRKQQKDIAEAIEKQAFRANIAGYNVPVLNAPPIWASEAGHILAQNEAFAAIYWDKEDSRQFSLRSAEDGVNVSEVAELFGGGGHRGAAGFVLKEKILPSII